MYKGDLMALEDINNNSICVKTSKGIMNMKRENDINEVLVYVRNISPDDCEEFIIKAGQLCRYIDIVIMPKMNLNSI